ncbi:MAG: hypothetical protein E7289_01875 [Lachnospiraceae bacterium]|nr:hypothetical protein [Lachnospiraceae bacterium]
MYRFKGLFKGIVLYGIVVAILISLRIASCCVPTDRIIENQEPLIETFGYRGVLPGVPMGEYGIKVDFWTESYYINNACVVDNSRPVYEAFHNTVVGIGKDPLERLINSITGGANFETIGRPQYWWGAQVIIRPLLYFMNYEEAATLWQMIFGLVFSVFIASVYRRFPRHIFAAVLLGLLSVNLISVSMIFHTSFVWVIAFGMSLFLMNTKADYARVFMLGGMLTAFFDWMSTPIVTFLLPIIFLLYSVFNEKEKKLTETVISFVKAGVIWALSYGGMHVIRWGLGSLVLRDNVFKMGAERVSQHGTMSDEGFFATVLNDIKLCTQQLSFNVLIPGGQDAKQYWLIVMMLVALIMAVGVALIYRKRSLGVFFSVIAFCPIVWIMVFRGWISVHYWFAYRMLGVSIVLVILSLCDTFHHIWKGWRYAKHNKMVR